MEYQKLRDSRPAQIRKYCALEKPCQLLLKTTMRQLQLTARAEVITQVHMAKAMQYRPKLALM